VQYDLTNAGDTSAEGWQDLIQVARARVSLIDGMGAFRGFNAFGWAQNDDPLAPGQTITVTTTVDLMPRLTGRYNLLVSADCNYQLDEQGMTDDNQAYIPIVVGRPPAVDLRGDAVVAGDAKLSQDATITWTATNASDSAAVTGWTDQIYWSRDGRLGRGDILLGSYPHVGGLDAGAQYSGMLTTALPPEALGQGFIIVQVNGDRGAVERGPDRRNNLIVKPITVDGLALSDFHSGQFVPRSTTVVLPFDASFGAGPAASVDVTVGSFQAFPLADIPGGGTTTATLIDDLEIQPGSTHSALVLNTSSLAYGTYTMTITIDRGGEVQTQQFGLSVVEAAVSQIDRLGDTVGGDSYEHFNMDAGLVGDCIVWRLATNHWSDGSDDNGDFLIRVGRGKGMRLFGVALADRTTDEMYNVTAGQLYSDCTFTPGEVVPRYLAKISTFAAESAGDSFIRTQANTDAAWDYDLFGGVKIAALGIAKDDQAARTPVSVSHTMYCGNDEITITIAPLLVRWPKLAVNIDKPQVVKLAARGDRLREPELVGTYTSGKQLVLKAIVRPARKDPVVAVVFEVNGQTYVDDSPRGGWTMPFTTELADTPLRIRAVSASGIVSDDFDALVRVV
jgi:hypothetical protein